ncbi:MAG: NAD(P)H-dependent oxidoreductase [Clostridiales bacterium]|nr:NAD(P)H-dependent oxidoreductase [Clostridiales bacterium]
MKTTIVYAHPWKGSFNQAVLEEVRGTVGDSYLIDLYEDGFDPAMSSEDLAQYGKGGTADPLVKRYNEILDDTNRIIFIFPIWWYDMPAMMRGFLDKVMLEGSAYHTDAAGLHPIRKIPKTWLITTSSTPTDVLINTFGDPMNNAMIGATFRIVGFQNAKWVNLGGIDGLSQEDRQRFLAEVREMLKE